MPEEKDKASETNIKPSANKPDPGPGLSEKDLEHISGGGNGLEYHEV
jgi:bacteriocin-like protein